MFPHPLIVEGMLIFDLLNKRPKRPIQSLAGVERQTRRAMIDRAGVARKERSGYAFDNVFKLLLAGQRRTSYFVALKSSRSTSDRTEIVDDCFNIPSHVLDSQMCARRQLSRFALV